MVSSVPYHKCQVTIPEHTYTIPIPRQTSPPLRNCSTYIHQVPITLSVQPHLHIDQTPSIMSAANCSFDIAIIGAGVMGTVMAHMFGNQGRKVLLLERDLSEPDRIVGELLQPGGVSALEKLGL